MIAAVGDDEQPVEVVGVCERAMHKGTILSVEFRVGDGLLATIREECD
jgi:hypothetical protein